MVVFNPSYSGHLSVVVPKGQRIMKATLLSSDKDIPVYEVARNEYNVDIPFDKYNEPFVIKLIVESDDNTESKYVEALI